MSGAGPDEAAQDLAAFGASAEEIEAWTDPQPEIYEVWPENWPAVDAFVALSTQWRHAGAAGVPTGLDYCAVEPVLRLLGHEICRETFERLRILEAGALDELAQRRNRT